MDAPETRRVISGDDLEPDAMSDRICAAPGDINMTDAKEGSFAPSTLGFSTNNAVPDVHAAAGCHCCQLTHSPPFDLLGRAVDTPRRPYIFTPLWDIAEYHDDRSASHAHGHRSDSTPLPTQPHPPLPDFFTKARALEKANAGSQGPSFDYRAVADVVARPSSPVDAGSHKSVLAGTFFSKQTKLEGSNTGLVKPDLEPCSAPSEAARELERERESSATISSSDDLEGIAEILGRAAESALNDRARLWLSDWIHGFTVDLAALQSPLERIRLDLNRKEDPINFRQALVSLRAAVMEEVQILRQKNEDLHVEVGTLNLDLSMLEQAHSDLYDSGEPEKLINDGPLGPGSAAIQPSPSTACGSGCHSPKSGRGSFQAAPSRRNTPELYEAYMPWLPSEAAKTPGRTPNNPQGTWWSQHARNPFNGEGLLRTSELNRALWEHEHDRRLQQ